MGKYTTIKAKAICEAIADGSKVVTACENEGVSKVTFYNWLAGLGVTESQRDELLNLYARAKETQIDCMEMEILEIADNDSLDTAFKDDGTAFVDHEHINRSRLRVDTRKWLLAKRRPKIYGDKQTLDVNVNPLEGMSDDEIDRGIAHAASQITALSTSPGKRTTH